MKKTLIFLTLALACFAIQPVAGFTLIGNPITLTSQIYHPGSGGIDFPRSPVDIPEAYLDDHTLYVGTAFSDDVIVQLVTVDDVTGGETVEYSTVLYAGDQTVVFPSTLSGTYELRIIVDWYYLAGEVEL